jgi:hypothetical protein
MKRFTLSLLLIAGLLATPAFAQLKKLGISDVKANQALVTAAARNDTVNSIDRVVQAFDSQLIDRMQNSRRFEIIARSDLASILKEADFQGGAFKVSAVDYLLVTTLDDFQDYKETMTLPTTGERLSKRVIRVTAVAKIYDAQTGKLIESVNVTRKIQDAGGEFNSDRTGDLTDGLLLKSVQEISQATSDRVVDVLFPARVLARTDKQVTINRGDGTSIQPGEIWLAFALGEELKDPDTGEVLEKEKIPVGKIRIIRVGPRTSTAEVIEDNGVGPGVVVMPQ